MKRDKPPYTIEKPSGWYWQPKGSIENFSSPQPLGSHMREAFKEGWRLYHEAKAALEEPSSRPKTYTVNWGIALWRASDDYRYRADGKPKAKNTLIAYESGLTAIEAKISMLDLRSLQKKHVKRWYKDLKNQKGLSSAASVMRTLQQLYKFFVDEGYCSENPASKLRLHVPKRAYEAWRPERIDTFCKKAIEMGLRSAAVGLRLIYDTAQNNSDCLRYQWNQYDGRGIDLTRGKTDVGAYVPLSHDTIKLLDETPRTGVQIVICEPTGRPYTRFYFAKVVRKVCDEAGLPKDLKAGNLRHEAAQEAEAGGAHPGAIQSLLAHKTVGTQEYYVKRERADLAQEARERYRKERKGKGRP